MQPAAARLQCALPFHIVRSREFRLLFFIYQESLQMQTGIQWYDGTMWCPTVIAERSCSDTGLKAAQMLSSVMHSLLCPYALPQAITVLKVA